MDEPAELVRSRPARAMWFAIGWGAVGLGTLGIVVPGLPATVFFIVAASSFAKSSPRFEQWVLNLPGVGPMVRNHRAGLGMPRRAKITAILITATVAGISVAALDVLVVQVLVLALTIVGIAYIALRVPTRENVEPQSPPPV